MPPLPARRGRGRFLPGDDLLSDPLVSGGGARAGGRAFMMAIPLSGVVGGPIPARCSSSRRAGALRLAVAVPARGIPAVLLGLVVYSAGCPTGPSTVLAHAGGARGARHGAGGERDERERRHGTRCARCCVTAVWRLACCSCCATPSALRTGALAAADRAGRFRTRPLRRRCALGDSQSGGGGRDGPGRRALGPDRRAAGTHRGRGRGRGAGPRAARTSTPPRPW